MSDSPRDIDPDRSSEDRPLKPVERWSRAVVRWRGVVVIAWLVCSALAVRTAPHVVDVLRLQSTTDTTMEGARADLLLRQRFARPLDEYFALTVVAPAGLSARRPQALLDSLTAALARQPYVSSTVS